MPSTDPWNTPLTPEEEQKFRTWVEQNKVPFNPNATVSDYDMRGFWKALQEGDPIATSGINPEDQKLHYTDYFKTPIHKSFSNESKFADVNAPHWEGEKLVSGPPLPERKPTVRTNYREVAPQPKSPPGDEELRQTLEALGKKPEDFGYPEARKQSTRTERMQELLGYKAPPIPPIEPLSQEEITSGRAFKVPPEPWITSGIAPIAVQQTPESKLISAASKAETPAGYAVKFAKPLLQLGALNISPAVPEFVSAPAKQFGELVTGKTPMHVYNPETQQVELSPSAQKLGAESALLTIGGGVGGTGEKTTTSGIKKWVDENPAATVIPTEIDLTSGLTKIGRPKIAEKVVERPGAYFQKEVHEHYQVGPDRLRIKYSMSGDPIHADVDFGVIEKGKLGAIREVAAKAPSISAGMETIATVVNSVENFVRKVRPNTLTFTAADDKLIPLYERFATQLADEHAGIMTGDSGVYHIEFPRNATTTLGSGLVGFATILAGSGALAALPKMARTLWPKNPIPRIKLIPGEFGPTNLRLYDTASDVLKTYFLSPMSGLFAHMKRVGFDNKAHFDAVETNTNAALFSKIDNALESGKMRGIDATYEVTGGPSAGQIYTAAKSLPKPQFDLANEYLLLLDTLDRMKLKRAANAIGLSRSQIIQRTKDIEKLFPEVKRIQQDYERAMMAAIEYQGKGRFSTIGSKRLKEILSSHRRMVPWEIDHVDPGAGIVKRMTDRALAYGGRDTDLFTRTLLERRLDLNKLPRSNAFDMLVRGTEMGLRERTLNGVKGATVDAYALAKYNDSVIAVSKKHLSANPKWRDRAFTVKESGVPHRYVSSKHISDILRFDPHFAQNPFLFTSARAFQFGTTGYGAPWFALTQFIRENQLANFMRPEGMKGIGIPYVQSTGALFQQVARRSQKLLADEIYRNLDSGSGRFLRIAFAGNENAMRAAADGLSKSYTDSLFYTYLNRGGGGINMAKNAAQYAKSAIDEALRDVNLPHSTRVMGETWKNVIDAMHNAGRYAFWARNVKRAAKQGKLTDELMDRITVESRHLTSELTVGGRYYKGAGTDIVNKNIVSAIGLPIAGKFAELARENTVWFNAMVKGYERLARAYWDNPVKFMGRIYTGVFLPTTLAFFWAKSKGEEYTDYMMKQRSEYDKASKLYIAPLNGRPEDGWEIPWAVEFAPLQYMFNNFLANTWLEPGNAVDSVTQAQTILNNYLGLTTPPIAQVGAAAFGLKIPGTMPGLGEDAYSPKGDPYSFAPVNIELMLRAQFGAVADVFLGGINTFLEKDDVFDSLKEMAYRVKQKTPVVKGAQFSSMNKVGQDFYAFRDKLSQWEDIYRTHILHPGFITDPMTKGKKPHEVDDDIIAYGPESKLIPDMVSGRTKRGKVSKRMVPTGAQEVALESLEETRIGEKPNVPPPTNPLFVQFARGLHQHFESRGNNWGKLMKRMNNVTNQIQDLKKENVSTLGNVKAKIDAMPEGSSMKAELLQFDWTKRDSLREAINYLEKERMKNFQTAKLFVREVQDRIEAQTGQKVDLNKLDPYEAPGPSAGP